MNVHYAGFWIRFFATMIDTLLLLAIIVPILFYIYGPEYFVTHDALSFTASAVSNLSIIVATLIFWQCSSATPGKLLLSLVIVDANTLQKPSILQFIIRYFAYIISTLPLCLGFIWIALDRKKQGWHDKLAKTVVVYKSSLSNS